MTAPAQTVYDFGRFRLDPVTRLLQRDGEVVPLKPKVFDTLLTLVAAPGKLITKDQLMQAVWPDSAVEENNLRDSHPATRRRSRSS
jgi:DNA-binding winged helix-turn-helix (wHTH) protein